MHSLPLAIPSYRALCSACLLYVSVWCCGVWVYLLALSAPFPCLPCVLGALFRLHHTHTITKTHTHTRSLLTTSVLKYIHTHTYTRTARIPVSFIPEHRALRIIKAYSKPIHGNRLLWPLWWCFVDYIVAYVAKTQRTLYVRCVCARFSRLDVWYTPLRGLFVSSVHVKHTKYWAARKKNNASLARTGRPFQWMYGAGVDHIIQPENIACIYETRGTQRDRAAKSLKWCGEFSGHFSAARIEKTW